MYGRAGGFGGPTAIPIPKGGGGGGPPYCFENAKKKKKLIIKEEKKKVEFELIFFLPFLVVEVVVEGRHPFLVEVVDLRKRK